MQALGNLDFGPTITGAQIPYVIATASGSIYTSVSGASDTLSAIGSGGNAVAGTVVLAAGVTATDQSGTITLARSGTGGYTC